MTVTAFTRGVILTPDGFIEGHSLLTNGCKIESIVKNTDIPSGITTVDLNGHMLLPGFIDIQVNGGGGVLLNADPSAEGLQTILEAHKCHGTTAMLPTLISDDIAIIDKAMRAVETLITAGTPGILGIHIEGPFLSKAKKGAHDANKFRTLDDTAVALLSSLRKGITLVTLAPEETTPGMIKKLKENGVLVSMGHTNATYEQAKAGLDAGINCFTHLFNAMTGLESRAPGVVGAALSDKNSYAGIIVDGHHVASASLKAAVNAKGTERMILVTDAMPSVGMKDKSFNIMGVDVIVNDGKCSYKDGTLAGSDLDMITAVRNTHTLLDTDLAGAVAMASRTPAAFLGISETHGTIAPGKYANLVMVDSDLNIQQVWLEGRPAL